MWVFVDRFGDLTRLRTIGTGVGRVRRKRGEHGRHCLSGSAARGSQAHTGLHTAASRRIFPATGSGSGWIRPAAPTRYELPPRRRFGPFGLEVETFSLLIQVIRRPRTYLARRRGDPRVTGSAPASARTLRVTTGKEVFTFNPKG